MKDITATEMDERMKQKELPVHGFVTDHLEWALKFMKDYEKRKKTPKSPRIELEAQGEDLTSLGRYAPTQLIKTSLRASNGI